MKKRNSLINKSGHVTVTVLREFIFYGKKKSRLFSCWRKYKGTPEFLKRVSKAFIKNEQ